MQNFQDIISEHNVILFKIGRVYSDAEDFDDLYQEMLIAIWKSLKNFSGKSQLSTWIYRVALNTALSYDKVKKKKWMPRLDSTMKTPVQEDEKQEKLEEEARLDQLMAAIQELRKEDRSIVLLYLEDKSYEEISEIVGISKSNVGVRINRAKKKLLEILKD